MGEIMKNLKQLMRETMWAPVVLAIVLTVLLAISVTFAPIATIYTFLFFCVAVLVLCAIKMVSHL